MEKSDLPTNAPSPRGFQPHRRVDGAKLRRLRQERAWSQEELAHQADLSERLIRKAESSGLLRYTTLVQLARALSRMGRSVRPEDLVPTETNNLVELVESLFVDNPDPKERSENVYGQALKIIVAGSAEAIPFSGTFQGMEGFMRMRKTLRETLTGLERLVPTTDWFVEAGRFSMWCDVQFVVNKLDPPVTMRFAFHSPSEAQLHIHFDTDMMIQALRRQTS